MALAMLMRPAPVPHPANEAREAEFYGCTASYYVVSLDPKSNDVTSDTFAFVAGLVNLPAAFQEHPREQEPATFQPDADMISLLSHPKFYPQIEPKQYVLLTLQDGTQRRYEVVHAGVLGNGRKSAVRIRPQMN